jgi:hypothetical protein
VSLSRVAVTIQQQQHAQLQFHDNCTVLACHVTQANVKLLGHCQTSCCFNQGCSVWVPLIATG